MALSTSLSFAVRSVSEAAAAAAWRPSSLRRLVGPAVSCVRAPPANAAAEGDKGTRWSKNPPHRAFYVPVVYNARRAMSSSVSAASEAAMLEAERHEAPEGRVGGDGYGAGDLEPAQSEIKDPQLIFDQVWGDLERERGGETAMTFPKEIIWLAGAPGAGKGTMSKFIMDERGITAPPLETSSLFTGEEAERLKSEGRLLGDREVVEAVFRRLFDPSYSTGVIVDGFPRTETQAFCIKYLHQRMESLYSKYRNDPTLMHVLRRPVFHLCVLYVSEAESIRRQITRGRKIAEQNEIARELGVGREEVMRATDDDEALARHRYKVFKDTVYPSLRAIRNKLHFHFIDAGVSKEEVEQRIREEFTYQSSLELGEDTHKLVTRVIAAKDVVQHARQNLVQRLNSYVRDNNELIEEVLEMIETDFEHILLRQALAGRAIIRSNNALLSNPVAVNMVLDILAERGYFVTLDVYRSRVPHLLDPHAPGDVQPQRIRTRTVRNFIFHVEFNRPKIRRG